MKLLLTSAGVTNASIRSALQRQPDARGLEAVATTSERLLEVMDRLTGLYEAALRDVLG